MIVVAEQLIPERQSRQRGDFPCEEGTWLHRTSEGQLLENSQLSQDATKPWIFFNAINISLEFMGWLFTAYCVLFVQLIPKTRERLTVKVEESCAHGVI